MARNAISIPLGAGGVDPAVAPAGDDCHGTGGAALERRLLDLQRQQHALDARDAELAEASRLWAAGRDAMLHTERMAAARQLAAGMAHEINNPIGYVQSNLATLAGYVRDLLALVLAYERTHGAKADRASRAELQRLRASTDMVFLAGDVPGLIAETQEGVSRVRRIIRELQSFTRDDDGPLTPGCDLVAYLSRTLDALAADIGGHVEVERRFDPVPEVACRPTQIVQLFRSLLLNAAQAVADRPVARIVVAASHADGEITVCITDSGPGIAPDVLPRIFDPFFSTRGVGEGMGMGLSSAHGIAHRHGGRLEVRTAVGRGSTFSFILPVAPDPRNIQ